MAEKITQQTFALISNVTHQAINPLNGVIGTLDNVIDGTLSGERREQRIKSARAQLEYTVSLIRNLAYFSQYGVDSTSDPKFNKNKTCVVPQVLIEAAQFFQEQATANGLRIEVVNRWEQNAVKGDPDLLRQVFMNIFDNFVKYGVQNSTVDIKQWIQKRSNSLIIMIVGSSVAFSQDEDIFALGVRGRAAQGTTAAGSGLGLHICKLIVERLFGGSISASYVRARSTAEFEIRIPDAFVSDGEKP